MQKEEEAQKKKPTPMELINSIPPIAVKGLNAACDGGKRAIAFFPKPVYCIIQVRSIMALCFLWVEKKISKTLVLISFSLQEVDLWVILRYSLD